MLYESVPLTTDDGLVLRVESTNLGALHLVLGCLSALSHHLPRKTVAAGSGHEHEELVQAAMQVSVQRLTAFCV